MGFNSHSINGASINGAGYSDEEGYQLWLRSPVKDLVHLVEIDVNVGTISSYTPFTIKLSTKPFPGYRDRIKSIGTFSRKIGEDFTGATTSSYGEIELYNLDGALDHWHRLVIDGKRVRVRQGDATWTEDMFRTVFECIAEIPQGSTQEAFKIRLRALDYKSNLPLQTTLIPTTTVTAGSNAYIPKAYGQPFNVEPVVVDATNETRQWNDGAVTSVTQVKDGGVPFQTPQIVVSAVAGNLMSTATAHGFLKDTRLRSDVGSLPIAAVFWTNIVWNGEIFCTLADMTTIAATSPDGITWTQQSMPVGASWTAIAWNGTVFCAVSGRFSASTVAATSPDGITWTARTLPTSNKWSDIAWNGSVFCAIASGAGWDTPITSPDGITWTVGYMPGAVSWTKLSWNGSVFCAISDNSGNCATSPDGLTWTLYTLPASTYWQTIAWNGSVFCALRNTAIAGGISGATSPDGITWTTATAFLAGSWKNITWGGDVFCAITENSDDVVTSPDGLTWSVNTLPATAFWAAMGWNGSVFCAIAYSGAIATTSPDGITWSAVTSTLPAPLALSTDYWVVSDGLTTTDFKVSATRGGSVITLTDTTAGGAFIGYHWTADNATGKVYLDSKPAGVLTLNGVAGSTDPATIIIDVLGATNVDPTSKAAFQALCTQAQGVYAKERENKLDVADGIVKGIGAWYGHSREGMFQLGRVAGNPASHDFTLIADDLVSIDALTIDRYLPVTTQHRVSYKKNFTKQEEQFADVSANNRVLFSNDYSVSTPATNTIPTYHALAVTPDVKETFMVYSSDAQTEATRLDTMLQNGFAAIFKAVVGMVGTEYNLGSVVKVVHPRFELSGGVNMTVVGLDDAPMEGKVTVLLFVSLADYTGASSTI